MTMKTKPFYKELKANNKLSVCGLSSKPQVENINNKSLHFEPGFSIRLTGDVKEVTIEELKSKNNPIFEYCIEDNIKYPSMTAFVVYNAKGEVFDFDFEKENRDHKLERTSFAFGDVTPMERGLFISDKCIKCGQCEKICSFDAISKLDDKFIINSNRCDECGNCLINCPAKAIETVSY